MRHGQPLSHVAEARWDALRTLALPIAQAAVAAGLAWYLAHDVVGHRNAFFAPIAALIALGIATTNRPRRVVELTLGVAVGIGVGDVLVWGIGSGAWQLGLVVFLAMAAAVLIGGGPLFVSQAASSAVLVATLVGGHNGSRFVDALIGGAVGLGVLAAIPGNPLRQAQRAGRVVFTELAGALEDAAAALEARDVAAMREALARARSAEPAVGRWRQALLAGRETALLSPLHWGDRSRLLAYTAAAEQLELAVRNTRVLARAGIRAVELDPQIPSELPAAVRRLAEAVRLVEAGLEQRNTSAAIEAATAAATLATSVLASDPDLTAAHVVGQVRSTAADLLRALGLEHAEAVDRIRRAATSG
ncbi:MAG TPA: FUSC family protein [Gaiellaceae bacterium]|nr:FUSC family protein [Gaiellaceae bacterium]